jgi:acyl carrier protein
MEHAKILSDVNKIFIDVLDEGDIVLKDETVAGDIEGWDSLNHIQLIVAIEKHFNIRFSAAEIQSWENVGHVCEAIKQKLSK